MKAMFIVLLAVCAMAVAEETVDQSADEQFFHTYGYYPTAYTYSAPVAVKTVKYAPHRQIRGSHRQNRPICCSLLLPIRSLSLRCRLPAPALRLQISSCLRCLSLWCLSLWCLSLW